MTNAPLRILIADDHDAIIRGVQSLIETDKRYQVVGVAHDGREALRLIRELNPRIVVLDYSLPELNGLDVARTVQREKLDTSILLYSMHDRQEIVSEVIRAGVRGFVVKSDPQQHLLTALDALSQNRPYFSPTISDALLEQFLNSAPNTPGSILTPKEREVVQLIAEGKLNKQVAAHLNIALKTVETHRSTAMRKLKVRTTAELVRWAVRTNLIQA
ncbi:response regulator transcription factor [Sphingomonas sp. SM33]|uniref:Response regulator transcription factor n=1 Tax=Sphingomonas telluris TaxID=2907998 RepID=A0ABS9VM41_9SPHN|nr:response regulator transcription factor [Sphingomonas telluris]MCH8616017.1 response regulator transcription factor [Sphingomonas telluris]